MMGRGLLPAVVCLLALLLTGCGAEETAGEDQTAAGSASTVQTVTMTLTAADAERLSGREYANALGEPMDASAQPMDAGQIAGRPITMETCGGVACICELENGDVWAAWQGPDGVYHPLTQTYYAAENWGSRFDATYEIEPFLNVLGRGGFAVGCCMGLSWTYDYYVVDETTGLPELLVYSSHDRYLIDLDGDGTQELLWYHRGWPFIDFQVDGEVYELNFGQWVTEQFPECVFGDIAYEVGSQTLQVSRWTGDDPAAGVQGTMTFDGAAFTVCWEDGL